jgi:phosphoglycolate phosphatase-like HAD superfamily hydrolase
MRRYLEATGRAAPADRVVIIGDTPLDVDCAHHNGCRCLAVATGIHPPDELRAAGADLVVDDLSDVPGILRWLGA